MVNMMLLALVLLAASHAVARTIVTRMGTTPLHSFRKSGMNRFNFKYHATLTEDDVTLSSNNARHNQVGTFPADYNAIKYWGNAVVAASFKVRIVWYGVFDPRGQQVINQFINDLGNKTACTKLPCPWGWWQQVAKYYQQQTTYTYGPSVSVTTWVKVKIGRNYYWVAKVTTQRGPVINTTVTKTNVTTGIAVAQQCTDMYSQGINATTKAPIPIDGLGVINILERAFQTNCLVFNPNDIYLVLTDDQTLLYGFCEASSFCGWHTGNTYNGNQYAYTWVGNSAYNKNDVNGFNCGRSCGGCGTGGYKSPSGIAWADGMVTVIAHELAEIATDPSGGAWYDNYINEVGDKCAWIWVTKDLPVQIVVSSYAPGFPGPGPLAQGTLYGSTGYTYRVQAMYDWISQSCVMSSLSITGIPY